MSTAAHSFERKTDFTLDESHLDMFLIQQKKKVAFLLNKMINNRRRVSKYLSMSV